MNIIEAKQIPLSELVVKFGGRYSHTDRHGELWFFSPFRPEENKASFKVNPKSNKWHDFGLSSTFAHNSKSNGGDVLDFWCDYNFKDRREGIKEALHELGNLFTIMGQIEFKKPMANNKLGKKAPQPRYKILKINDRITFVGLKDELIRRRISLKLAQLHLKQGEIIDNETGKKYTAFLFENDKGGYEVSIPNPNKKGSFKTCIGPKASTRILVSDDEKRANVFEGFWDMLSWLEIKATLRPLQHTYVLNSVSLVKEVSDNLIAFNETVKQVLLFLDNDDAGYKATHALAANLEEHSIEVGTMECIYENYKDLNEYWAAKT